MFSLCLGAHTSEVCTCVQQRGLPAFLCLFRWKERSKEVDFSDGYLEEWTLDSGGGGVKAGKQEKWKMEGKTTFC